MNESSKPSRWHRVQRFLFHDMWDIEVSTMSAGRGIMVRALRIGHLVFKGFKDDELPIHASALTFVSLMSLVPILAIAFAFLKGLGFGQEKLDSLLAGEWRNTMPVEFQGFIDHLLEIVNTTNFSALGWIGAGIVMVTAVMVLANVETSFNHIWGINRSRNVLRRMANYISILVVVPILISIAGTIAATMRSEAVIAKLGAIGFAYRSLLRCSPLFSAWLAFGFLYVFLPNTRVKAIPALISGLVGALLWLSWQKLYITLQIGVAKYNAIYGTFASIPIFLAWLHVSWIIVLLGAEVAFAVQNESTYHLELRAEDASLKSRAMLGLAIVLQAAAGLEGDGNGFEATSFAREHRVPFRLLSELTRLLVRRKWLAEVADQPGQYVLLRAPEKIHLKDVMDAVMEQGSSPQALGLDGLGPEVKLLAERIEEGLQDALSSETVADFLHAAKPVS